MDEPWGAAAPQARLDPRRAASAGLIWWSAGGRWQQPPATGLRPDQLQARHADGWRLTNQELQ
eukprot:8050636-Alexandrium_andersonii.AAC.1